MISERKRDKHVYLPEDLIESVEQVIRLYGSALRVKNFSQAVEDALRRWLAWIRHNEDRIREIIKSMKFNLEEIQQ